MEEEIKNQFDEEEEDHGQGFHSWKFSEFEKHDRGSNWYVWGALVLVLIIILSVVFDNILFGLMAILSALIILMFHRSDEEIEFTIFEDGIKVNKKFYPYKSLINFYIIYQPPTVKTLYFEPKAWYSPRIPVALEDQNPIQIREVLLKYLDEDLEKEDEPVSDKISRIFKL